MAAFLSDEWFAALEARAAGLAADTTLRLRLRQVVDDVSWVVAIAGGAVVVERGDGDADVTLTTDRATAAAMASGEVSAQDAMAAGRLRLGGDLSALLAAAPVLDQLR